MRSGGRDSTGRCVTNTLAKGMRLLEIIANLDRSGVGLSDLSKISGWHKSTLYRYLTTLTHLGYLDADLETKHVKLGSGILKLSTTLLRDLQLRKVAFPHLHALMLKTRETVHLGVLEAAAREVVVVDKVDGPHDVRMYSYVGIRLPVHSTALGKAILAFAPTSTRARSISHTIPQRTDRTITSQARLIEELEVVRRKGFSKDDEENQRGIRCVGAPVFDHSGSMLGAVSISVPADRLRETSFDRFGAWVMSTAHTISTGMKRSAKREGLDAST